MTRYRRTAIGTIATLAIALAATAAIAHTAGTGGDMQGGMGGMHGGMHGMHGGMGGGMKEEMGSGMHGMHQDRGVADQLMTPEERQAMRDKMRSAKSPEERQALAAANRAEMEKRAKEKGITLPEHRAGGMGGRGPGHGGHQH